MIDTKWLWKIRGGRVIDCSSPRIMGIINYSEDSFVAQSRAYSLDETLLRIQQHIECGADIIDIGVESTKPYAKICSPDEEREKLSTVLQEIENKKIKSIFSIDSYKASVLNAVVEYRCDIINDVTGFADSGLVELVCEYQLGYVLTFTTRYNGNTAPCIDDVLRYFEEKMSFLIQKGCQEENIVLDIGVGFGYTYPYSLDIMRNIKQLYCFNRPLLLGASHKTWYQQDKSLSFEEKERASIVTTGLFASTIHIHRVHNVAGAKQALHIASTLV